MPKEIPTGTIIAPIPRSYLKGNDECVNQCAHLIGSIVIVWSLIEATLSQIYTNIACNPDPGEGPSPAEHWIALETFEYVQNIKQKRSLLIYAAERRGLSKDTVSRMKDLLKQAQTLYDAKRIVSAHGRWMYAREYPDSMVYMRSAGKSEQAKLYSMEELKADFTELMGLAQVLSNFLEETLVPELRSKTVGQ